MEILFLKISYYKKKLKLTNKNIAELSGLPIQTVERISSGRIANPNLKTLKALTKAFNCSLDDLFNFSDAKTPVLLDKTSIDLVEQCGKNESVKRLFEIILNLDETDVQTILGLAERLYVTKGDSHVKK